MMLRLALILALCALAWPAQAQYKYFNDKAISTGTPDDHFMLSATSVSATVRSPVFSAGAGDMTGLFKIVVSNCTGPCNITLQIEIPDPADQTADQSGTWFIWDQRTAITATTTGTYYWLGCVGSNPPCTAGNMTGPPTLVIKPLPSLFRIAVVWNSGTAWSGNVTGVAW